MICSLFIDFIIKLKEFGGIPSQHDEFSKFYRDFTDKLYNIELERDQEYDSDSEEIVCDRSNKKSARKFENGFVRRVVKKLMDCEETMEQYGVIFFYDDTVSKQNVPLMKSCVGLRIKCLLKLLLFQLLEDDCSILKYRLFNECYSYDIPIFHEPPVELQNVNDSSEFVALFYKYIFEKYTSFFIYALEFIKHTPCDQL